LLGGFRRGNGWPAEVPAALDVEAEFKVEALGFVAGVQQQRMPALCGGLRKPDN
jgi:hypothetical protein